MAGGGAADPGPDQQPTGAPGAGRPEPPAHLLARHPFVWTERRLGHHVFGLFALPDPDALLDALTQEEFDRSDARMPYWAVLWPSASALAEAVLDAGPGLAGRRVLDLGCGLGLVGLAALHRGAHVVFLDWEPVAVEAARASAWANGFSSHESVVADWRSPPPLEPFDVILAADVLYEARNGPAVARFLAKHLVPDGEARIADPDRLHAKDFPSDLAAAGLVARARAPLPPRDDAKSLTLWTIGKVPGPVPAPNPKP